jgi:methyl-accepting chemotaxis protein
MKWFSDLKIGTKIFSAFVVVSILTGIAGYLESGHFSFIMAVVTLVLGAIAGFIISSGIQEQISQLSRLAEKLSTGDVSETAVIASNDEMGRLASSLRTLAENEKALAQAATRIAQGDFAVDVPARNEKDALGKALQRCANNFRTLEQEITRMAQYAKDGNLSERCKSDSFQGTYTSLLDGVNNIMDALTRPVGRAIKAMNKVVARDLTARMVGDYRGDHSMFQSALNKTIQTLDDALGQVSVAAEQVSSASAHISEGSQVLSQGASEQAGSIEEVSSSLHEVASMTRQNSENAKEARSLSKSAETAVEDGVGSMNRLSEAIGRIKASSDSTAKIIKTIDEIAFQTNLLALNAAVEAARAGDAGKGFAVVAEEVRNLAMRSAEAAKNTATLIEESVKNSENGVNLNQEVLKNLNEINGQVKKVGAVMAEIAAASEQQAQGVDQVNGVINQMNIVTQQIAANAEESASGAEELSGQAEELKSMVRAFQLSKTAVNSKKSDFLAGRTAARSAAMPSAAGKGNFAKMKQNQPGVHGKMMPSAEAARLMPFDEADPMVLNEF